MPVIQSHIEVSVTQSIHKVTQVSTNYTVQSYSTLPYTQSHSTVPVTQNSTSHTVQYQSHSTVPVTQYSTSHIVQYQSHCTVPVTQSSHTRGIPWGLIGLSLSPQGRLLSSSLKECTIFTQSASWTFKSIIGNVRVCVCECVCMFVSVGLSPSLLSAKGLKEPELCNISMKHH